MLKISLIFGNISAMPGKNIASIMVILTKILWTLSSDVVLQMSLTALLSILFPSTFVMFPCASSWRRFTRLQFSAMVLVPGTLLKTKRKKAFLLIFLKKNFLEPQNVKNA